MRLAVWVVAILLLAGYVAWYWVQPRGPFEFAYAPFTPEPLPYAAMRGFTYEQLTHHVARLVLLTPALLLMGWAIVSLPSQGPARPRRWVVPVLIGAACLYCAVVVGVLRGRAIVDDELAYAMQARFLSEGHVTDGKLGFLPVEAFSVLAPDQGYTGKYLPGEPIVQILGVLLGIPALLHVPLLAATLLIWKRTLAPASGEGLAASATAWLAISPMLILTSATGLSHLPALLGIVLLGWGVTRCEGSAPMSGALMGALGMGFAFLCRPQSALPAGVILGPLLLVALWRRRSWSALAAFVLAGAALLALLLYYDWRVTGHPLRLPWFQQCVNERYGLGRVWTYDSYLHTPWRAIENLGVVAVRLNAWWLGLPASLLVLLAWLWKGPRAHGQGRWLWVGAAILLFEAGYYSTGVSDTGAVYHFELLLPGSIIAASVTAALVDRFGQRAVQALVVVVGIGSGSFLVEHTLRIGRLATAIHRDSDQALARIQTPALLLHETWESETLRAGWVMDSFPRRFRGLDDPTVTFPRLPAPFIDRIQRAYPNRTCYYYHRRHPGGEAEILPCAQAASELSRPVVEREWRPSLWLIPTAYRITDFNPFVMRHRRRVRDRQGQGVMPCCAIDHLRSLGEPVPPEQAESCVADGPSPPQRDGSQPTPIVTSASAQSANQ